MAHTSPIKLATIADWHHLAWALQRASRGKRHRPAVQQALAQPEATLAHLSACLGAGILPCGQWRAFTIYDPKQRQIHAAPFLDRVAHHALVRRLEPVFERVLLPSVFACRPNKGVHGAVAYAQRQMRRFAWVMHLDIAHYFAAIRHTVLQHQLRRRFRGDGLQLMDAVIYSFARQEGRGLPIGALTSQHFANHYLNDADRWVLMQPEITAHCRYMDDYLLWGNSKRDLRRLRDRFIHYLQNQLGLQAKIPLIQSCRRGIRFCGIHIKPHTLRPSQRRRRRYRRAVMRAEQQWRLKQISDQQLQHRYAAARAILLPADQPAWRRHCLHHAATMEEV